MMIVVAMSSHLLVSLCHFIFGDHLIGYYLLSGGHDYGLLASHQVKPGYRGAYGGMESQPSPHLYVGNIPPAWPDQRGELPSFSRGPPQSYGAAHGVTTPSFVPVANRLDPTLAYGMTSPLTPLAQPSLGMDFGRFPSASPQSTPNVSAYTIQPPASSPVTVDYLGAPSPRQRQHLPQPAPHMHPQLQPPQHMLPPQGHPFPQTKMGMQQMPQPSMHHMSSGSMSSSSRDRDRDGPGGSNAQGRAINKMLLDIVRERTIDPQRLQLGIDTFVERMDCVNLATLLFHTGKKRFLLAPIHVKKIADRFQVLKEELRSREASNALYGMKCLSSEVPEVRVLIYAVAGKIANSSSDFVAQAVGNALYGCQMMTSEYEEVRYLLLVLATKVNECTELLEAQNVGNALYGMRGMNSDYREVRAIIAALGPKIAKAKEELNGQALGNSLYGLQSMSSKEPEVRSLLTILAQKAARTWEELKAQEVGNALYGLKRMSTDVIEVRMLIHALVPKIASSPELLDAQAIGNSFYGLQNMKSDNPEVLHLLSVLAEKVVISNPELDGQAMGNSLYGLQGMSSEYVEVRSVVSALTQKIQMSCLEMNAQELGNALYGVQNMTSHHLEVKKLMLALATKIQSSRHELTSQEIGNALFGLQGMTSDSAELRYLVSQLAIKILQSHSVLDPQGVSNSLFGIQKLASDSTEVQSLVNALSAKIGHCFKVLGSHHIAHSCFGLQSLSSDINEVRGLIRVLVPKYHACREEMSAKQLSHALYGLQNMASDNVDVLAMLETLAEKVVHCVENWTLQHVSLAFYGLQGMDSKVEATCNLLNVLNQKLSFVSWTTAPTSNAGSLNNDPLASPCPSPLNISGSPMNSPSPITVGGGASTAAADAIAFANMMIGFQRFTSDGAEVTKLANIVLPNFYNNFVHNIEVLTPAVLSNVFWGLQGFSCVLEPMRKVVDLLLSATSIFFEKVRTLATGTNASVVAVSSYYMDLMHLFQCATLSLFVMPDLSNFVELNSKGMVLLRSIEGFLESYHELFYQPRMISVAENNFMGEVRQVLPKERFVMKNPHFFKGFEIGVFIQAANVVSNNLDENDTGLTDANGTPVGPARLAQTLAVEVVGTSYAAPSKAHFFRIRNRYLEQEKGLSISMIPADACRMPAGMNDLFGSNSKYSALLSGLFPTTLEDAHHFLSASSNTTKFDFVAIQQQQAQQAQQQGANNVITTEYFDDEYSIMQPEQGNTALSLAAMKRLTIYTKRKVFAVPLGWIGDHPAINSAASLAGSSYAQHHDRGSKHHRHDKGAALGNISLASTSNGSIKSATSVSTAGAPRGEVTLMNPYTMVEKGMIPAGMLVDSPYGVAGSPHLPAMDYGAPQYPNAAPKSRLDPTFMENFGAQSAYGGYGLHSATDESDVGSVGSNASGRFFGSVASGGRYPYEEQQPMAGMMGGAGGAAPFPTTMNQGMRRGPGHGLSAHSLHNTSNSSLGSNFSDASGYGFRSDSGIAAEIDSSMSIASAVSVGRSPSAMVRKSPKSQARELGGSLSQLPLGSAASSITGGSMPGSVSSLDFGNQSSRSEDEYADGDDDANNNADEIGELEKKLEMLRLEQRLKELKSKKSTARTTTNNGNYNRDGYNSNSESPLVLPSNLI